MNNTQRATRDTAKDDRFDWLFNHSMLDQNFDEVIKELSLSSPFLPSLRSKSEKTE